MTFQVVSPAKFQVALTLAFVNNRHIEANVQLYTQAELADFVLILSDDRQSGFAVKPDGELTAVFSAVKGRGMVLVREAIRRGAFHLNAFDGYLTGLYGRCGFVESKREPNWTAGQPDVVFMELCPVLKLNKGVV